MSSGQPDVERALHRGRREIEIDVDAGHLAERVNAGVGAAGAGNRPDLPAVERRERLFDDLLNRETVDLPLPADVVRAVVGQREFQGPHAPYLDPGLVIGAAAWHIGHPSGW